MEFSILTLCYLIGSITFIIGLKMLSDPANARKGNLIAAAGMTIAIAGTIFLYESEGEKLHNYGWIFGGLDHWRNCWNPRRKKSADDRHARNGKSVQWNGRRMRRTDIHYRIRSSRQHTR